MRNANHSVVNKQHNKTMRINNIFKLSYALFICFVILVPFIGYVLNDVVGYIAFAFLPASILINICVLLVINLHGHIRYLVKTSWILLALLNIVFVLVLEYTTTVEATKGLDIIIPLTMGVLSFPSSFIIIYCEYYFTDLFLGVGSVLYWLLYFVIGYVQWFILLPAFICRITGSRGQNT